jgi:hypothetical protein
LIPHMKLLRAAGVRILIGSDQFRRDLNMEIRSGKGTNVVNVMAIPSPIDRLIACSACALIPKAFSHPGRRYAIFRPPSWRFEAAGFVAFFASNC